MAPPDVPAALEALARASTWEGAMRLYFDAVPGASRVEAEAAFQQAAAQGWLLAAIPELRLLVEAWQAVGRVQEDAERARQEAEKHRLPDGPSTAMDRNLIGTAFAKCNDSALRGEAIGLTGLATVHRCLAAWRRASIAFEREYKPVGREQAGHEEWRRACKKLLKVEVAEGNLAMALSLAGRIRDPEALQVEHLDPLVQAREYALGLVRARQRAEETGDTATLVQVGLALSVALDRVSVLSGETTATQSEEVAAAAAAVQRGFDVGRLE